MRQKKAKNKKEKPAHTTQNGQTGNGCKSLRKSGNQTRRPGNDAAECGQRKAAEGRHDCGKPHAQPPGGGTSLHPGAASQTGQTAAAKAPHTQAHGGQTASRPRQRRPDQARHKSSRLPTSREQGGGTPAKKTPGHRAQKSSQQRQVSQKRPPRQAARRIGRRKNPPNRQNSRSLFCLPGGAM